MIWVGLSSISSFVAQKNQVEGFQEGIKNEESNIEIGYDFYDIWWLLKEPLVFGGKPTKWVYLLLVYLVTALVPSLTACLASSSGRSSLMAVWISRELITWDQALFSFRFENYIPAGSR